MAGNLLRNAGLLDQVADWSSGGGALTVNETTIGAPGRAVLVTGAGGAATSRVDVIAGEVLEISALAGSDGDPPRVEFVVFDGGGAVIYATVIPYRRLAQGRGRRGLISTFNDAYARLTVPVTGRAWISFTSFGGVMSQIYAMRPYIGRPGLAPMRWDPGAHGNPDLQLPVWPADLPSFRGQVTADPITNLKAFAGDVGIPANTRLYGELRHQYRGQMRLSPEQDDVLTSFYRSGAQRFFMVRQDTAELCIAEWLADGVPRLAEMRGPYAIRDVGFHTTIA